uniref:Uncharacterized protein n=1 Tax=Alexandrium monilatum TaxID=311494 RepID=A0A7S4Q4A1_9DINO
MPAALGMPSRPASSQEEVVSSPTAPLPVPMTTKRRWAKRFGQDPGVRAAAPSAPAPPVPPVARQPRPSEGRSFCLQHYHSTGCAGGAFAWRAAKIDPSKGLQQCRERREFRATTAEDIALSLSDKQRGQGPRVGSFQRDIPGESWMALPKYDYTTHRRSSAFNERMHVEWENHVDHILANNGKLPTASVVAKAGFRSCAPCCRDMLALARPTGKTFIMVDMAEQDDRGTFHFVCGDKYLPVPKEHLNPAKVTSLKQVVLDAQGDIYPTSEAIHEAVLDLEVPVDTKAQALYLGDRALLPAGCARDLRGDALLDVLHAEHFARLAAEYGASILRDPQRPEAQRRAVLACRARAEEALVAAWARRLPASRVQLQAYAASACLPLLPDDVALYELIRRGSKVPQPAMPIRSPQAARSRTWKASRHGAQAVPAIHEGLQLALGGGEDVAQLLPCGKHPTDDDAASSAGVSTATPDDGASTLGSDGCDSESESGCP